MKRWNWWVALCVCCLLTGCYNANESRENVLKVYNWADYIGEGVLEDFQEYYKEKTGEDIRIVYQTFDINEIMLTKIEKGHEDFDVVCPSEYIIERMLHKGLLQPIDTAFAHSPNYMNGVAPYIRQQIDKLTVKGNLPLSVFVVHRDVLSERKKAHTRNHTVTHVRLLYARFNCCLSVFVKEGIASAKQLVAGKAAAVICGCLFYSN